MGARLSHIHVMTIGGYEAVQVQARWSDAFSRFNHRRTKLRFSHLLKKKKRKRKKKEEGNVLVEKAAACFATQ